MAGKRQSSPIGTILEEIIKDKGWQQRLHIYHVFDIYESVVGPDISRMSAPAILHGTVLWVGVADSVWMHSLHLQKTLLMEKLNEQLTEDKLTDIRFRIDTSLWKNEKKEIKIADNVPALKPIDPKKIAEFEQMTAELPSESLRAAMQRVWMKWSQEHQ